MNPHVQSILNGLTLGVLPLFRWLRDRKAAKQSGKPVLDPASVQQGVEDLRHLAQEVKSLKRK